MSSFAAAVLPFTLQTADPSQGLTVRSFTGEEAVSKLFRLHLLADAEHHIPIEHLLGQDVTFQIQLGFAVDRTFLAQIRSVEELGTNEHNHTCYALELVPRLWAMTENVRSRIFVGRTALEIIDTVFSGSGIQVRRHTRPDDKVRPYCVQYFESDFDFVVRLLEEEGYIYRCGIENNVPTFVIESFPSAFPSLGPIPFHEVTGATEERIGRWRKVRVLAATAQRARDHYFEAPAPVLDGAATIPESSPAIPGWEPLRANWSASVARYPGNWAHLFEAVNASGTESPATGYLEFGNQRMWYALQQAVGTTSGAEAASNCPRLAPASVFELAQHPACAGEHFIVSVTHKGSQSLGHSRQDAESFTYENQFISVPYAQPMMYLPPRSTRKPLIQGCQTAKVLGSSETDEIRTDKYGRIQLQFWWDEDPAASSCWVRVATPWAGSNWGLQHIPRAGQEVVVTFLDGDPDRPLVVGSVFNPTQMPPFALPANKTQSGIRTHTPGGSWSDSNEIRFEDKQGSEEIYIHAQRDRTEVVENDAREAEGNDCYHVVGNDRHETVGGDQRETILGRSDLVVAGDAMHAFGKKLGVAASEIHFKATKIVLEADTITIRTTDKGKEFIQIEKAGGITIESKGEQVWVNCGGADSPEDGCYSDAKEAVNPFAPPPAESTGA